jgi:hypothetical protein
MATTIALSDCTITVTVKVQISNSSGLPDAQVRRLLDRWRKVSETYLNGPKKERRWRCCRVFFVVEFKYGGAPEAGYHQIEFRHDPRARLGGSHINGLPEEPPAGSPPRDHDGVFVDSELATGGAHEIGHLLGVDDKYHYDPATGRHVNEEDQPGDQPESIMAQTWGAAQFLQSHIDESMRRLGATCPPECCPPEAHEHGTAPPAAPPKERPAAPAELKAVIQWATDGGPWRFAEAAKRLSDPAAVPTLIESAAASAVLERWVAVSALAGIHLDTPGDPTAAPLRKALADGSMRVAVVAAAGLVHSEPKLAAPVLHAALLSGAAAISRPPVRLCDVAEAALVEAFGALDLPVDDETADGRLAIYEAWSKRLAAATAI